ncbi:hypothetical protein ACFYUY_29510 [Kitasatospora sp. NPDC004745]|uniref:hypothetical protein n=1 Tax=Kitasatospora sp. NPDC004745 TaxID=3364019 RepID=UPI0036BA3923
MTGPGGRWVLPAALAAAVVAAGAVGYLDWRGHRPADAPGRAARLCGLPTGAGTPLGRLLPAGGQDVEEERTGRTGVDPRSCTIRVDGRTALTLTAVRRDGEAVLPPEAAGHPDAHAFDAGSVAASWSGGAAVSDYCTGGHVAHVQLAVTADGAAPAGGDGPRRTDLEQIARDGLPTSKKDVCR